MRNILYYVIYSAIFVLVLMSILAIVGIHMDLYQQGMKLSISPKGIETYLLALGKYKYLFTGTIATCSAFFGLQRLQAAIDANVEKIKQDDFTEWKAVVNSRVSEIQKRDPLMEREIIRIRKNLFNDLHRLGFNIGDKTTLTTIFNKHFTKLPPFFENANAKYMDYGGIYPSKEYAYSFDSFRFLFYAMMQEYYQNLEVDLNELYLASLPSSRFIDQRAFAAAQHQSLQRGNGAK